VGLWIGPDHQGKGFGTEVVAGLIEIGFGLGYRRLEAGIFVGNVASRRIFEKSGFQLAHTVVDAVQKQGRSVDEWILTIERQCVDPAGSTAGFG
jgi:RimJ/RimL family protein N-acetyltransferase